jgi:hypothetical protein
MNQFAAILRGAPTANKYDQQRWPGDFRAMGYSKFESGHFGVIIAGMCRRFTLRTPPAGLVEVFDLLREPELAPRYNIAPTRQVLVFGRAGEAREFTFMRWGLVPSWAKDARSEPIINDAKSAK